MLLNQLRKLMSLGQKDGGPTMHGIFINYRRGESAPFARALYNVLAAEFGDRQVFMDVEDLREPGKDFVDEIQFSLDSCAAMLTLIGKDWIDARDRDGAVRLKDPRDFVRLEIATALKRDVRVIPVLLEGARMPDEDELPDDLTSLARRQALKLAHESWDHNVGDLMNWLARIPGLERKPPPGTEPPPRKKSRAPLIAAIVVAAVAVVFSAFVLRLSEDSGDPTPGRLDVVNTPVDQGQSSPPPRPESRPVAKPSRPTPQYSENVYRAQQLLNELSYDAGVPDGFIGPTTTTAIREFESDEGYSVRGKVTDTLLARLEEVLEYESRSYEPVVSVPPNTAVAPSLPNLSGVWYDNAGIPVLIEQSGSDLIVGTMDVMSGQVVPIGTGVYRNGTVTIQYSNAGFVGTVIATLAADGRHLNGTDTNAATGYSVTNSWHFDHYPSH